MNFIKCVMTGKETGRTFVFELHKQPYATIDGSNREIYMIDGYKVIKVNEIIINNEMRQLEITVATQWQRTKKLIYDLDIFEKTTIGLNKSSFFFDGVLIEDTYIFDGIVNENKAKYLLNEKEVKNGHYKKLNVKGVDIQPNDIIAAMAEHLPKEHSWQINNAIKYLLRSPFKHDDIKLDLAKAYDYLGMIDGVQDDNYSRSITANKEILGRVIDENHNFHKLTQQFEMLTGKKFDSNLMQEIAKQGEDIYSPFVFLKEQSEKGIRYSESLEKERLFYNATEKTYLNVIKSIFMSIQETSEDFINESKK